MQLTVNEKEYHVLSTIDEAQGKQLRLVSTEITTDEMPELVELLKGLFNFVGNKQHIAGLALPQLGIQKRAFIMNTKDSQGKRIRSIVINPEIIEKSEIGNVADEGCLSEPGVKKAVKRAYRIRARYTTETGEIKVKTFVDYAARIFQHELDHLDGILLSDKE